MVSLESRGARWPSDKSGLMRRAIPAVLVIVALMSAYLASAVVSLTEAVRAAQSGDGERLRGYVDIDSVRGSISSQVVAAYLAEIGETRRISQLERTLAMSLGTTIADAVVDKILTPENLAVLLKSGRVQTEAGTALAGDITPLAEIGRLNLFDILGRVRLIKPVEFAIRLGNSTDPERTSSFHMHFEGDGWKLSAIKFPKAALRELASKLPRR